MVTPKYLFSLPRTSTHINMHILNINLSFNDYFSLNMAPKVPFEAHIIEAKRNNGILLKTPDNFIMNRNTTIGSKQYFKCQEKKNGCPVTATVDLETKTVI